MKPVVAISDVTGCNRLLRAGQMAQELWQAIRDGRGGLAVPHGSASPLLWDHVTSKGHPDSEDPKKRLRVVTGPGRDTGQPDRIRP